jgi:hypothetical protein
MNQRMIGALCAVALSLVAAPVAQAAPFLSKARAQVRAKQVVRAMANDIDGTYDFAVGGPSSCTRFADNRVSCGFEISFEDGTLCHNMIVVTLTRDGFLRTSFPLKSRCEWPPRERR